LMERAAGRPFLFPCLHLLARLLDPCEAGAFLSTAHKDREGGGRMGRKGKRGTAGTDSGIVILCFTQEMLVLVITASTHTFGQLRQNKHSNTQSHKLYIP